MIVLAMQNASKGSPASKGIKVGDFLATPEGYRIKVTKSNLTAIKALLGASVRPTAPVVWGREVWPCPPPPKG